MIPYHGTPLGGKRADAVDFLRNRHALVPWHLPEDMGIVAECCRSFCLDNGAFSAWGSGEPVTDWSGYYSWVDEWRRHPGFDWAVIPDVIDGDEAANNALLAEWPFGKAVGVPVWHLHESLERLIWLATEWPRIALGNSGQWPTPDRPGWWERMDEAMAAICVDGRPRCRLHGLRMLNVDVFRFLPLASADSTNAAQNASRKAMQVQCSPLAGRRLIAEHIESVNSARVWTPRAWAEIFPSFMGAAL